jgi:hypothetical protein
MPEEPRRTIRDDPHPVRRAIGALPRGLFRIIRSMFLSWHTVGEGQEMTKHIRETRKSDRK